MKSKLIVAIAAGSLLALAGTAAAYHSGGVAECEGCHTMHNSLNGSEMADNLPGITTGNRWLLQGSDASSTCLNCHGGTAGSMRSYKMFSNDVGGLNSGLVPGSYTPGGDFGWLLKDFEWDSHGIKTELGEEHGHNVVAADYGLAADTRFMAKGGTSPGGSFSVADLGCNSCHDPHGKYRRTFADGFQSNLAGTPDSVLGTDTVIDPIRESGSYGAAPAAGEAVGVYRLLAGPEYTQVSGAGASNFNVKPGFAGVPEAVAPRSYNKTGGSSGNAWQVRVAYQAGWTDWCLTCHGDIADANHHEVDNVLDQGTYIDAAVTYADIYNGYVASGDLSGNFGTLNGAYNTLVPFQDADASNVATDNYTTNAATANGATANSRVMCLSCHRAHASGHQSMTRWSNRETMFIVEGEYGGTDGLTTEIREIGMGRTQAETAASYYNMPAAHYATYQRSLCNKCHAKD